MRDLNLCVYVYKEREKELFDDENSTEYTAHMYTHRGRDIMHCS